LSRYHTRHALARARGALSRTKRTTALLAGLAATGATAAALIIPSSASALSVHAIYLRSNPRLAVAAPNKLMNGSPAQLKSCNAIEVGFCANDANIKVSQQFIFPVPEDSSGALLILNEQRLCLTNRSKGGSVTFETCGNAGAGFASQQWDAGLGARQPNLAPGFCGFTLQNAKSGGFLSPATQPTDHTPLTTTDGRWTWGISGSADMADSVCR
jgi:hypothetical protein